MQVNEHITDIARIRQNRSRQYVLMGEFSGIFEQCLGLFPQNAVGVFSHTMYTLV